jgi:hypothetical protein
MVLLRRKVTRGISRPSSRQGKYRRKTVAVLVLGVIVLGVATARLFIWPDRGMPAHVSAIVMLNGPGDRLDTALTWPGSTGALRGDFPGLVLLGPWQHLRPADTACDSNLLNPDPANTRGEAEFVGRLARKYRWQSVALVTITPQDSRARLRVERCFAGPVYVMTAPLSLSAWLYQIAYEWGALTKALIFQRSC